MSKLTATGDRLELIAWLRERIDDLELRPVIEGDTYGRVVRQRNLGGKPKVLDGVLLDDVWALLDGATAALAISVNEQRRSNWEHVLALVKEQSEDEALWATSLPPAISEAYVLQELGRLHAAIEAVASERTQP